MTPPGPDSGPPLSVRAWERLLSVQKCALASVRDSLEQDMTLPRYELLGTLCRGLGQTLAELARKMGVKAKNLSGVVERAERDGLVERKADPASRRAWTVHLTPKGQRAFRDAERRHHARLGRIFAGLAPAELLALTALLDKLRASLRDPLPLATPAAAGTRAHAERSSAGKRRSARLKRPA
ncbi:MAG: MarR family transcriptional regulator [Minicystis sp.]